MGISKAIGRGAIRLTLGRKNTEEEIRKAAKSLIAAYNRLKS
jgi:cysteine sulfinate desulfinase/cysteine desulfurase-like protein